MRKLFIILLTALILLTSCVSQNTADTTDSIQTTEQTTATNTSDTGTIPPDDDKPVAPKTNKELYSAFLEAWKNNRISDYYEYASAELCCLLNKDAFIGVFNDITGTFGSISSFTDESQTVDSGYDVFRCKAMLEYADVELTISIKNLQICGITHDIRFVKPFDKELGNGITESYFLLESGEYKLNAVYTFCTENNSPAVLLVPGSGPSDFNETVGLLTPFKDIAIGLAKNGVNSMRFEKRTYRYPDKFTAKSGIDEEYYEDCKAAVSWLEKQNTSGIYLLGHSLGGQIAAALAEKVNTKGIILFNSSARHLADISADQYSRLDPSNKTAYEQYAQAAKAATADTAKGLYYYSLTDYYWASYNEINVIESLKNAGFPTLIINSSADNQTFTSDFELWEKELSKTEQVTVKVYDDISHFGYKIDMNDTASLYKPTEFPKELIEEFVKIIK